MAAFTFAAAFHLSMVALASLHRELPLAAFSAEVPIVEGGDVPPEPTTVTEPVAPVEAAPPLVDQDFVDAPTPPTQRVRRPPAGPVRPPGHAGPVSLGSIKPALISAPRPEYPYEARRSHLTGAGVALVTVDPTSGFTLDARMEQSTGDPILDRAAVSAFKRWRFKAGAPSKVRIPVIFTLAGASL